MATGSALLGLRAKTKDLESQPLTQPPCGGIVDAGFIMEGST